MGRLERGDDPLGVREELERLDHLGVRHGLVAGPPGGREVAVLGTDARVVEPGRDGLGLEDLADLVLEQVALHPVDDAGHAPADGRAAGRLDPDQLRRRVDEPREDPHGVRSPADARGHDVRRPAEQLLALAARLVTEHPLQLPHQPRVGMGSHHRAQAVVRALDGGHPVPHGLVDRVLEGPAARVDGLDLGAEEPHPEDVEGLALDVDRTHVDLALHPQQRGRGRRGHAVLARPRLGHQPALAHPLGQQRLAEDVVDLVRAGVVQVLPLEQQPQAQPVPQVAALGEGRRPAGVVAQEGVEVGPEAGVGPGLPERGLQLLAGRDEALGDEAPAELAEASLDRLLQDHSSAQS